MVVVPALVHVLAIPGVGRGEQFEDVQRYATRIDPLEDRAHGVHGGGGGQPDHRDLEGADLLEDQLVELPPQVPVPVLVRLDVRHHPLVHTLGVENEMQREETGRALVLCGAQIQYHRAVEVGAEHLVRRDGQDGFVAIRARAHGLLDVDVVPPLDGFVTGVRGLHGGVQPQGLEEGSEALLPVEQEEVRGRIPVRVCSGECPGAESGGAAGLQGHHHAQRIVQRHRRDDGADPVVVPFPVPLEVGQL